MEYHGIGERFEYDGVVLEVMEYHDKPMPCSGCYFLNFHDEDYNCEKSLCRRDERKDKKDVIYRFVEKCKPNDIEQKIAKRVEDMDKVFATQATNNQSDEEIYGSLLDKLFATYKEKNADYGSAFSEMFDELGIDYAYGNSVRRLTALRYCASSLIWSRMRGLKMLCSIRQGMRY